ncbi:MAG: hypothetical protein WAW41_14700 [Methylobacter sp.]
MELIEVNKGKLTLHFHAGQTRAWESKARFPAIVAGTQSGKTSFAPWWLWNEIETCGEGDYLAVTATYDLFKLKFLPELQKVFGGYLPDWKWMASERVLSKGNTRIILRSADAEGGLEAATVKAALFDECGMDKIKVNSWEAIQRRLSLNHGRCLLSTTPYNLGWLKSEIYDRWRNGDPDFEVIQFKSIMNPSFPKDEYERMKLKLPSWKFEMFYNGEFSRPAGMIYGDFDFDTQVIAPVPLKPEWPRWVGIDFGAIHTALIWIVQDPEKNVFYIYRESLEGSKTTAEHAGQARANAAKENVVMWIGGAPSEKQQRWDWLNNGINVLEPYIVDVESGIDKVIELIKSKRLYIFDTCVGVIDEVGRYSRELNEHGQPTEKIKDKADFHLLDALRYDVIGLDTPTDNTIIYDERVEISPF